MSARAQELGERVLAGLAAGRQRAIAAAKDRGRESAALVIDLAALDVQAGRPARGRAGRIARKLRDIRPLSERHVRRILDQLYNMSEKTCFDPQSNHIEDT